MKYPRMIDRILSIPLQDERECSTRNTPQKSGSLTIDRSIASSFSSQSSINRTVKIGIQHCLYFVYREQASIVNVTRPGWDANSPRKPELFKMHVMCKQSGSLQSPTGQKLAQVVCCVTLFVYLLFVCFPPYRSVWYGLVCMDGRSVDLSRSEVGLGAGGEYVATDHS